MSGDLRLLEVTIDPEAIDPEDAELLQDMVLAAVNEAMRSAQELAAAQDGRDRRRPRRLGGLGGCRRPRPARRCSADVPAADQPPGHRALASFPGSASARRSGSPSTSCAPTTRTPRRWPTRFARSRRRSGCARSASTSPRARAAGSARTSAATVADLRRRGAGRRDPDRAHGRVSRPLPRARRRALADRRHRPRGPEDRRARRAASTAARVERGRARDQPDDDRRGDRPPHRRPAARQGRRSPGSPAACRSAPTSSTPTRSPSAGRSPGESRSIARPRLGQGLSGSTERAVASGPPALRPWASG